MIVDDPVSRLAEASPFEADRVYGPQWWDELYDREGDDAEHCRGALAVVHGGCALYTLLVVTGPARGRLVRVDLDGGLAPLVLDDVDFLAWYERWLDDVIAGYGTTFFHDRLLGGEVAFVAGARDADPARRARAVSSFNALPEVSEAGRRAVVAAVGDPDARVRAAALWTARRLRIGEAVSAVRGALTHPEAETRRMALGTLSALGCADLPGLARGLLADPVGAVVAAAVLALQEAGALTVADVAPLVRSVDVGVRVAAVHGLREAHGDVTGLVAGALADPEARVRWTAVQAAEKRGLSGLRPVLARLLEAEEDPTVLVNLRRVVPALEVR
ncbi:HEAT repeat domain-containing protein [Actinocorallia sp. A-T 12471]|uniref:HEAT repeat domain-containing protein n=1 Tax=Actinocorallia sp. A-T 12471 TaxID=3089813 RepID=UPI0029D1D396|nr:HEAT repeat domain-containing protein [Actinocorallia sp. A-T 12471]MDX6741411.1 HEAT repeat domain-containing protein [Actinocorallia sp. A-T 12471]